MTLPVSAARAGLVVSAAGAVLGLEVARADLVMPPYLQAASPSGMCVMAECTSTNPVTVEYGLSPSYGRRASTAFSLMTSGTTYVHRIMLTGLEPDTSYHYQASHEASVSDAAAFTTLVKPGEAVRFAFTSDFQSSVTNQKTFVSQLLNTHRPRFLLYGGDMAARGTNTADWKDHFFSMQRELIARTPFFGCVGNHDRWVENTQAFLQAPDSPSGEQAWYSFDAGPAHILVLNTSTPCGTNSPQYAFAKADLAAATHPWKIVAFHMPAYSAGSHGENKTMIAMTTQLFEPAGVDLVLSGHNHFYQHNVVNGIHHLVLGSAGAGVRQPGSADYTVTSVAARNVGVFDVTSNTLSLVVFDEKGAILDSIDLRKE